MFVPIKVRLCHEPVWTNTIIKSAGKVMQKIYLLQTKLEKRSKTFKAKEQQVR